MLQKINLPKLCKNLDVLGDKAKFKFPLKYELMENKVKFFYETGYGRFEPRPFILPQEIVVDKNLLTVFGLLQAEMTKVHYLTFDFSNSNPILIKFVIDYFGNYWK